ncbi:MAG TPA: M48 family metalloprotease [Armatimonadota bacterium]|nr:M48 family metalloprotease [Armatimonadota bacterium]
MFRTRLSTIALTASLIISLVVLQAAVPLPVHSDEDARKHEIEMGREAAAEVEKENKLVTDPQMNERVNTIGQRIAAVANSEPVPATYGRPDVYRFDYKFKVIDDNSVNAFSLPGGLVYVHTGLLNYVQSDHELAGVLAHEIAHASHHHVAQLLKQQSRLDAQMAFVLLAGVVTGVDTEDLGNLLIGAQLVRIARGSRYGQKAEADADATAVIYVEKAGYNPVGTLTFLERLASDYANGPNLDMGIMQTHPATRARSKSVLGQIRSLGLPVNRRAVADALKAKTEQVTVEGQPITQVKLGDNVLFEPAPIDDAVTSEQRAEAIATKVNQLLDSEPLLREVALSSDGRTVLARGEPIIVVTAQDSSLYQKPVSEVAAQAAAVLKHAIWQEMIHRL